MFYRVVCKNCGEESPVAESTSQSLPPIDAKCKKCGKERMSMEVLSDEEREKQEFVVVVSNKRSGATRSVEFSYGMKWGEKAQRQKFIDETATALAELLTDTNISSLIG